MATHTRSYSILYYRDRETVRRFREHGGIEKQEGYQTGKDCFVHRYEAEKLASHINDQGPVKPALVIPCPSEPTVDKFVAPRKWF